MMWPLLLRSIVLTQNSAVKPGGCIWMMALVVTVLAVPGNEKASPTWPAANVTPLAVPSARPKKSSALPSPGHQYSRPAGTGAQLARASEGAVASVATAAKAATVKRNARRDDKVFDCTADSFRFLID